MFDLLISSSDDLCISKPNQNGIPWNLPSYEERFSSIISKYKYILIGHNSYDLFDLSNFRTFLFTRDDSLITNDNIIKINDLNSLTSLINDLKSIRDKVLVLGGAKLLNKLHSDIFYYNYIYYTRVHTTINGDMKIPDFFNSPWYCTVKSEPIKNEKDEFPSTFYELSLVTK